MGGAAIRNRVSMFQAMSMFLLVIGVGLATAQAVTRSTPPYPAFFPGTQTPIVAGPTVPAEGPKVPIEQTAEYDIVNGGYNCWNDCGQQGGFCDTCGGAGACCHASGNFQGNSDNRVPADPEECVNAKHGYGNFHSCVLPVDTHTSCSSWARTPGSPLSCNVLNTAMRCSLSCGAYERALSNQVQRTDPATPPSPPAPWFAEDCSQVPISVVNAATRNLYLCYNVDVSTCFAKEGRTPFDNPDASPSPPPPGAGASADDDDASSETSFRLGRGRRDLLFATTGGLQFQGVGGEARSGVTVDCCCDPAYD